MKKILLIICVLFCLSAQAKVKLPSIFSDNMVLQQQSECNIWGWAEPGTRVSISTSWDKKNYMVMANKEGRFQVSVKTPKAGGPYFIGFKDKDYVLLNNVMIGEVWLCSGQSNMDMKMKGYKGQPVEGALEDLMTGNDPELRFFTSKLCAALTPQDDVAGQWSEGTTANLRNCSATAYYFAHSLRKTLGVPVGLIITAYGGSACEAWMNPEWLQAFPQVQQQITQEDVDKKKQRCPTALYNGQLHPFIGYGIKGAIWYQGEDNVPRYSFYADLLKTMVEGWRSEWKQGEFPFYFCQIAPFEYDLLGWKHNSAYLREQQLKAEEIIPNARMAVLMDAGLEYGIHPRKKRQAGERLALLALGNTYDMKGLPDFATYKNMEIQGDTCIISFDRSKEWVYFEHGTTSNNFEVAGKNKVFHPATKVWTSRNKVYVKCDDVFEPVAVRYAFKNYVDGDLMHDGLPVSSFRTDDWTDAPQTVSLSGKDYNNPQ